ncbi:hypothetical protein [Candidatus Oscillochloris fontis]|uniref:hypothetical protein n=1 Tax=Candidatus Oscillochloris fontis TaxID=2496868 RepID=UPI00101C2FC4|nr:hypothetical protein [Candidatus Oscillochloris fontis]
MQPTDVLLLVTDALETLGVTYCVGGSFASSTYGEPRATRDVDILASLPAAKAGLFTARIAPEFFVQISDLRDAIALAPTLHDDPLHRASCNLVHRTSFFRVDLFIASGRPYELAQFARRVPQTVALNPERRAYFVSPEDIILIKLDWYRMAQGALERQWIDVQSVLTTQGSTLDIAYLRHWAAQLALADLLDAALRRAPPPRLTPPDDDSSQMRLDI